LLLQNIQITTGGTGYTAGATVTIDPPFTGANLWTAGVGILLGQRVEHNNTMYQATRSGALASPAPKHKSGIVANGTAALEYIGSRATGTVNVSSGVVTGVSLKGSVFEVNITICIYSGFRVKVMNFSILYGQLGLRNGSSRCQNSYESEKFKCFFHN
jgi:hypothetical protein